MFARVPGLTFRADRSVHQDGGRLQCQTCHKWPEEELKARVETIQTRTFQLRNLAMDALVDLIDDLKGAKAAGLSTNELAKAQDFHRKAQFYLDFVEAENSTSPSTAAASRSISVFSLINKSGRSHLNRLLKSAQSGYRERHPSAPDSGKCTSTLAAFFAHAIPCKSPTG